MRICFQVGVYCNYVTTGAGLVEQMGLEGACMEHRKYLRRGSRVWLRQAHVSTQILANAYEGPRPALLLTCWIGWQELFIPRLGHDSSGVIWKLLLE